MKKIGHRATVAAASAAPFDYSGGRINIHLAYREGGGGGAEGVGRGASSGIRCGILCALLMNLIDNFLSAVCGDYDCFYVKPGTLSGSGVVLR